MRQLLVAMAFLSGLGLTGLVVAENEQDIDAIQAACKAEAEDQGVTDIDTYVAECVQQKAAQSE